MQTKISELTKARFWSKVKVTQSNKKCWIWTGAKKYQKEGAHGNFRLNGKSIVTSRLSFLILKGDIPRGFHVCHRCDNPPCVNPEHLFLGTQLDNVRDSIRKGRFKTNVKLMTHCKHGHEMLAKNIYFWKGEATTRRCIKCRKRQDRCRKERKKKLTAFRRMTEKN